MAQIPGWIFLAVGVLVAVVSWLVLEQNVLFLAAGGLLLLYGAYKMLRNRPASPKAKHSNAKQVTHVSKHIAAAKPQQPSNQQHRYHYCPHCRNVVHTTHRYCSSCGARIR